MTDRPPPHWDDLSDAQKRALIHPPQGPSLLVGEGEAWAN